MLPAGVEPWPPANRLTEEGTVDEVQEEATAYRRGRPRRSMIDPDLITEIRRLCEEKGWRKPGEKGARNGYQLPAYLMLADSEVAEALEAYRDKVWSSARQVVGPACHICVNEMGTSSCGHHPPKPIGVGPEIADALIRLLDIVDMWDIDIEYELRRVMDHNWDRPYQHGGRDL